MTVSPSLSALLIDQTIDASGVFIALGSNQSFQSSSPSQVLDQALALLAQGGDHVTATSSYWESDAWPVKSATSRFTNAVCQIRPFDTNPTTLMERLHAIEAKMGRQRDPENQWSPRSLDLDLLDYNGLIQKNDSFLTLPHPRIEERDFVLLPLAEICPSWRHPITGSNVLDTVDFVIKNGNSNNCRRL